MRWNMHGRVAKAKTVKSKGNEKFTLGKQGSARKTICLFLDYVEQGYDMKESEVLVWGKNVH